MAFTILNIDGAANLVTLNLKSVDAADFVLIDSVVADGGNTRESLYQYIGTDSEHPATVRVGWYKKPTQTSVSVKFSSWLKITETDQPDVYKECSSVLAFNMPTASGVPSASNVNTLIQHTIGVLIQSATANVADNTQLDQLAFGVTGIL
jgi:hypothetical protein